MSRNKKTGLGRSKLLDCWLPPDGAGAAIGCLATTYTFQADFFEEECLSRFLDIMSTAEEDGSLYIIERDEKLNEVECAAVWVDQSNAGQARSLRWDLIPFRLNQGILHAKVSILRWKYHVRVLVGSANLTAEGYRKNREVIAVLDVNKESTHDKEAVLDILDVLLKWMDINKWSVPAVDARSKKFLENSKRYVAGLKPLKADNRKRYKSFPIFIEPHRQNFFEKLNDIWRSHVGPVGPSYGALVSPFFDASGDKNKPLLQLTGILKKRGDMEIEISTMGQWDEKGRLCGMMAPENLLKSAESIGKGIHLRFHAINPQQKEGKKLVNRLLHAKSYWFENDKGNILYMVGSSNFTNRGLGLMPACNLEANLAIVFDKHTSKELYNCLDDSWIIGDEEVVDINSITWMPEPEEDVSQEDSPFLHPFFHSAIIKKQEGKRWLEITFSKTEPPVGFAIYIPEIVADQLLVDERAWLDKGKPEKMNFNVIDTIIPSQLKVIWNGLSNAVFITVNVDDILCLPPAVDINQIPLSVLAATLTSSKPVYQILGAYLRSKQKQEQKDRDLWDPLKRIDTSTFLLQRTRGYSAVINSIQTKLEQPFATAPALEWRINGPVGIMAVMDAMVRQALSNSEAVFFLIEVWHVLGWIKPVKDENSIPVHQVKKRVVQLRHDLKSRIKLLLPKVEHKAVAGYAKRAFLNA